MCMSLYKSFWSSRGPFSSTSVFSISKSQLNTHLQSPFLLFCVLVSHSLHGLHSLCIWCFWHLFSAPSKIVNTVLYILMSYEAIYCSGQEPEVWHQRLGFKSRLCPPWGRRLWAVNSSEPQFPSWCNGDNSSDSVVVVSLKWDNVYRICTQNVRWL